MAEGTSLENSPLESPPKSNNSQWVRETTRIDLRPGFNSFTYTDTRGRIIPVYYYLPSQFATEPVEPSSEPVDSLDAALDECQLKAETPDATDLAEEAAEDESEVEETLQDGPIALSSKEDDEAASAAKFSRESVTSQDVIFVMHGVFRDAKQYCMQWKEHAKKFNIFVVCPEFNVEHFPKIEDYQMGGIGDDTWGFTAIEHIFDILNNSGVRRNGYNMYGHSAGAQFAHRYAMFMSKHCRLVRCVCANAGWYTFPLMDSPHPFPYSLRRVPSRYTERHLRLAFSRQLCILLGQDDEKLAFLRRTPGAMEQGANRFERGINFFLTAKRVAASMEADFNWFLKTVPRTGHVSRKMAHVAVKELFGVPPVPAAQPKPAL